MLEHFGHVVVVDDGSDDGGEVVESCREAGAEVIFLPENVGIGAALNQGAHWIQQNLPRLEHLVTFDQDSEPLPGFLAAYDRAARAAHGSGIKVGSISPDAVSGTRVLAGGSRSGFRMVSEPIQSGTLIPMSIFQQLGGFNEALFIDGVDTDTYWRLRSLGYQAISAEGAALRHQLGERVQANLLGHPVTVRGAPLRIMQSAPFRYYYLGRNRLLLLRWHGRSFPLHITRGLLLDLRHILVVVLLGSARRQRVGFLLRGIADGLRGRTGRMPATNL
ncbi:glycosyltransferase [Arthrobacter sp. TMN-37]